MMLTLKVFWAVAMQNTRRRFSFPAEHQLFDIRLNTPFAAFKTSRCSRCLCQVSIWDLIIVGKNDDSVIFFQFNGISLPALLTKDVE